MARNPKATLLRSFRMMLRPVIRILLRGGVTWKDAAEVCKLGFVEVATSDFGLHGRPTNISRVAILTGLSRREVSQLRRQLSDEAEPDMAPMNSATRVLTGWYLDPEFLDDTGRPLDLPRAGSGASFETLARRYGGDIAPITLLRELRRVGAIEKRSSGRLRVLRRYYMPSPTHPEAVLRAGSVMQDIGNTLAYNLALEDGQPTRFEGRATNEVLRAVDSRAFRAFLEREGQAFLERVDEWLATHEATPAQRKKYRLRRFGVGVYQIQDDE
ncbi:MAG TPA: hypothetical protein ENK16_09175 [Chromatiales bacterium]|nr:hypothetical protein [Chromatiales bacterium]